MAKKKAKKKVERKPMFSDLSPHAKQAIAAVLIGTLAIFFTFALFDGAGPLGSYTNVSLNFLFGSGAWLAPVACLLYIYVLLNPLEDQTISTSKVIGAALLFVSALAALELYQENLGGITGLALAWPLQYLIGATVAGIIIFGTFLVAVFLTFNTGFVFPRLFNKKDATEEEQKRGEGVLRDFFDQGAQVFRKHLPRKKLIRFTAYLKGHGWSEEHLQNRLRQRIKRATTGNDGATSPELEI